MNSNNSIKVEKWEKATTTNYIKSLHASQNAKIKHLKKRIRLNFYSFGQMFS